MFSLLKQKLTYHLTLPMLVLLNATVWLAIYFFPGNRPKIIFCDVGQGDATLITQGFMQILIDGGPDRSVLKCLSKYTPFFDKKIEVVVLTHPEVDHLTGLLAVFDKYQVDTFVSGPEGNDSAEFQQFIQDTKYKIQNTNLKVVNLYTGDKILFGNLQLKTLWPEREWVTARVVLEDKKNTDAGTLSHFPLSQAQTPTSVLGASTSFPLNSFGLVFLLNFPCPQCPNSKSHKVLLMADADSAIQDEILAANPNLSPVDILKFPHHGSKTGISETFLNVVKPKEAVISVGKNSFGHPTKEALDLLEKYQVKVERTDQEGNIVVSL